MNRKQPIALPTAARFRRWSRKGYAIFASLGRCVTIGRVCKSITERALTKQLAPCTDCPTGQPDPACDDDDAPAMTVAPIELLLAALTPQPSATRPAPCGYSLYNSINRGRDALNASCNSPLHNEGHKELQDAFNASLPISPYPL